MRSETCHLLTITIMRKVFILGIMLFASPYLISAQSNIAVIMDMDTGYTNQSYFYSGSSNGLQKDEIKKYWDEGKYITSVAHTSVGWFVSMNKGVKWTSQSYNNVSTWPDSWVHEKMNDGYAITSLAASDSQWMIVMSKGTDYSNQQVCSAPWSSLKDWISKWWDQGLHITGIAYCDRLWTVVMSKTSIYSTQAYLWASSTSELSDKIKKKWDEDYLITALEYGGGEWFCIMTKFSSGKSPAESYKVSFTSPGNYIKEYWDKSYQIKYIGG